MMNSFAESEHAPVCREIEVRFYAELHDFLPPEKRQHAYYALTGTPSVKDTRATDPTSARKPAEEPCGRSHR